MIYLIEAATYKDMDELDIPPSISLTYRKKFRRAVVSFPEEAGDLKFPKEYKVEKHPLMNYEAACEKWLSRSLVDDLLDDYRKHPPTPKVAERCQDAYFRQLKLIADTEAKLQEAREALKECSANLVRTHGRGPISMRGKVYDLCSSRGLFVFWRDREEFLEKVRAAKAKRGGR